MERYFQLIQKAGTSKFYLWILNRFLLFKVPFNRPHGLKIKSIHPGDVEVLLPYKRINLNHLKGIHACALATLCEYVSGLCITTQLSSENLRLIMKSIQIEFNYQARMSVRAKAQLSMNDAEIGILVPLQSTDAVIYKHTVQVFDSAGNSICNAQVNWQFKKWDKVKTR